MTTQRPLSQREQQGIEELRSDHARVLAAIEALERAARAPSPRRRVEWLTNVRVALSQFHKATDREGQHESAPTGVLEVIRDSEPRLAAEVDHVEQAYRQLSQNIGKLAQSLEQADPEQIDVAAVRREISQLLAEYHQLQAREVDLVYDAYNTDIGAGD